MAPTPYISCRLPVSCHMYPKTSQMIELQVLYDIYLLLTFTKSIFDFSPIIKRSALGEIFCICSISNGKWVNNFAGNKRDTLFWPTPYIILPIPRYNSTLLLQHLLLIIPFTHIRLLMTRYSLTDAISCTTYFTCLRPFWLFFSLKCNFSIWKSRFDKVFLVGKS